MFTADHIRFPGLVSHKGKTNYYFTKPENSKLREPKDVVSACSEYFVLLLEIVYDCYVQLGIHIDPQQHYTKDISR